MPKKLTTEEFIEKARLVHGDKYDYSKVEYINSKIKVCIICPIHGEFWQTPNNHINGQDCYECAKLNNGELKRLTTAEFIKKARLLHGDKYDYSKSDYISSKKPICIICPIHGKFWQTPNNHLNGAGCHDCANLYNGELKRLTTAEFIIRAIAMHGDKYDYSKVIYIDIETEVCIICPTHGEFWQRPHGHFNGQGCPSCSGNKQLTGEEWINKAKEVHNDKYDYSKVLYVNTSTKVCIICPKHGEFWQRPNDHISNQCGCPKCTNIKSKWECDVCDFLTINNIEYIQSDRKILHGSEIDIYIPKFNIGIECDGLYWHSDINGRDNSYHLNKTIECDKQGIQLIHIFEDEWCLNKEETKTKLLSIFSKFNDKVHKSYYFNLSGNLKISIMDSQNNDILASLSFNYDDKKQLFTLLDYFQTVNINNGEWILFNEFLAIFSPKVIIGSCDRRWGNGDLFRKLNFEYVKESEPNFFYVYGRKTNLNLIEGKKENKIYDCGRLEYIYRHK